ncbi:hypothetical protein B0H16DRAFT_1466570 [Mycena metata]|uniref:Uncharacterized protein n=1 Tax=Mycena metata TaxID=1033252 RepID=A0AAD7I7A4_9AGAR|nr:hypothetical protein B0H16DRAFT_1466570 [Mycena metata]
MAPSHPSTPTISSAPKTIIEALKPVANVALTPVFDHQVPSIKPTPVVLHHASSALAQQAYKILKALEPALDIAKEGVTAVPVPGLEAALKGIAVVTQKVLTMQSNKDDLENLHNGLKQILDVKVLGCSDSLHNRLIELKLNLNSIARTCESLTQKSRMTQFWRSKQLKGDIQSMQAAVITHVNHFMFAGNISIEKLIGNMENEGMCVIYVSLS